MYVANLELCKELYNCGGWVNTYFIWMDLQDQEPFISDGKVGSIRKADGTPGTYQDAFEGGIDWLPAYDLGYLLRKLPKYVEGTTDKLCWLKLYPAGSLRDDTWMAIYLGMVDCPYTANADTPEDAACKLAIELFKQNILKKS